jgi:hypothetical protein
MVDDWSGSEIQKGAEAREGIGPSCRARNMRVRVMKGRKGKDGTWWKRERWGVLIENVKSGGRKGKPPKPATDFPTSPKGSEEEKERKMEKKTLEVLSGDR